MLDASKNAEKKAENKAEKSHAGRFAQGLKSLE